MRMCTPTWLMKLDTAAEHLPSMLDRAAAEKLSLTAAWERLLALGIEASRPASWPSVLRLRALRGLG